MTIPFRPFSEVKMILEEAGTDVSYAYDDLIFAEHLAYLIQFDDITANNLKIYFNTDLQDRDAEEEEKKLRHLVEKRRMTLTPSGRFAVRQKENSEEIEISFFPSVTQEQNSVG